MRLIVKTGCFAQKNEHDFGFPQALSNQHWFLAKISNTNWKWVTFPAQHDFKERRITLM